MKTSTEKHHTVQLSAWLTQGTLFSYRPGQVILAWGDCHSEPTPTTSDSPWFYFPDYFLENKSPWLHFSNHEVIDIEDLITQLQALPPEETPPLHWKTPERHHFEQGFNTLQKLFQNGDMEKVVLFTVSKSKELFTSAHRQRTLLSLLKHALTVPIFLYGRLNESEGILGATPELLFRLNNTTTLETMALAGTQKTDAYSHTMLKDKKLLREHSIVVDDICTQLSDLGEVTKDRLQLLTMPYLTHLYTPISVKIDPSVTFATLVQKLHPTPALGGFPRPLAWNWLYEYNKILPRGLYGAPVGFYDPRTQESTCYVAIRNISWDTKGSTIAAGCGIVAESDLETEWEEVLLKTKSIKGLLHL